jgi:tetratricopeptide (TPR) repeat protein
LGGTGSKGASQVVAAEAIFTQAIANDPAEMTGYQSRASFRAGIGDRKGALADLSQAIKIEPSVELYLRRAGIAYEVGDISSALADAQAARALDPSSADAIGRTAWYLAEKGELARGIALIDERIALGGTTKSEYQSAKANLIGEWGDAATAIKLLDGLLADKPGTPSLLNARCWIKGIRNVMLDTALKDCTSAIELSENTIPMLDSRAMVWFRMGRFDDALRDIDTVLASAPSIAQSRFLRGIVLRRLARNDEAAKELVTAQRLDASIDRTNARYGIKP